MDLGLGSFSITSFKEIESFKELFEKCSEYLKILNKQRAEFKTMLKLDKQFNDFDTSLSKQLGTEFLGIEYSKYSDYKGFDELQNFFSKLAGRLQVLQNHLDSYESYHNWMFFFSKRNSNEIKILKTLKKASVKEWKNIFKAWYYREALVRYEERSETGFNKSDTKLQQLAEIYDELSRLQIRQIQSEWNSKRRYQLSSLSHNFNALYNLRKNKTFGRRNSLRKIIDTNLDLFTTLFPVILINPVAANAILPLEQGLFNLVIFDESSQLRIADTFTSLIRGQYKIIAGDKHQMPPSSYFQSTVELLDEEDDDNDDKFSEEDEQAILAESDSLLQYAEDLKRVNKSYLDFHYRSNHPALIEFSNQAFYGGNLISFPEREVYSPIDFRAVNGRYASRVNQKEVIEVLKILQEEIHPNQTGKYPSIGIGTFNINQRNLITEAINEAAELDSVFARKVQELKEQGLFIKNLENIQGDERDVIILSTTYGIKPDGKFSQNFARLNRIEGYKLLNVLVTRAKHKLYVCTSIPKEKYISYPDYIQNEGNNKKGILYAYLAYAEAISNHDNELAEDILRILKEQSYEKPRVLSSDDGLSESPFEEEVYDCLLDHFKKDQIIQQHKVGGFRLDFVIKTENKDIVLECDGKAYHQSDEAHAYDIYRQKELENLGFSVYRIWSTNWFQDKETEIRKFLSFVSSLYQ